MLVFCTSCGKRISDRVAVCPFCRPVSPLPQRRGRSPLVYVLAGCGAVMVLGILGVGVGAYWLKRNVVATVEEQRTIPDLRTARATELLHAERLPDGYYAVVTARSPFLDIVLLGDLPAQPSGEASGFHQRGFMYTRVIGQAPQLQPIRSFVAGQANNSSVLRAISIDLATNAIIRRGTLDLEGDEIRYCAQRGDMKVNNDHVLGLQVITLVDCPDRHTRVAVWFGPDPSPGTPVDQFDVTGTVADEKELRKFLSNFKMCRR